jgi:rRNA maturation endonuclease Nob1
MNELNATVTTIEELEDEKFYRVADLQAILKTLGLNYSIYTIRDYETWKCLNYECGKRYNDAVDKCPKCGSEVRSPLIDSPRTRGGGKGVGHRRYTGADIKRIVEVFKERS